MPTIENQLADAAADDLFAELVRRRWYRAAHGVFVQTVESAGRLLSIDPESVPEQRRAGLALRLEETRRLLTQMWQFVLPSEEPEEDSGED